MKKYFDKLYKNGVDDFYKIVENNIKDEKRMFIVTANPETFTYGANDLEFNELLLDEATTLVPDGIGIVKASRMIGYDIKERITGVDLASFLLNYCNKEKKSIAFLGATQEVLDALNNVLKKDYPNIKVIKSLNGYTKDKDSFFNEIKKVNPDVCLVALGIPAQEKLIYKHLNKFKKGIFIGVGGSLDVLSGTKKRAPKIFQKLNLEWLYRILKEPKRIKRFWNNNVKFLFKVRKYKQKDFK
jgi:N-acetylglucosaminyldiphosphoundecaprenol N-acetyl-beta-D-mannosaminyltransferase